MLQEQINALSAREISVNEKLAKFEDTLKSLRNELAITKKAKKSLERLEEQLNGDSDPESRPQQLAISHE